MQELLFERGIDVTHEAIRQWCRKFGQAYANQLKRRRAQPGDKWHLDEVFLTINGQRHYLWRAVDQEGNVLDILIQRRGIDNLIVLIALRDNRRREGTSCRPTVPLGRHRCIGDLPPYLTSLLHFLTVLRAT